MAAEEFDLDALAHQAMLERELLPVMPSTAIAELTHLTAPATAADSEVRDLREMLWCSIDNDDSRDLDQLSVSSETNGSSRRLFVAIADVDALVRKGSAIDNYAAHNTTSVYTPGRIFPMLPEKLSTDLTSLNPDEERLAVVISMDVTDEGEVIDGEIFRARVFNHAKLAYDDVGAWLEGQAALPPAAARIDGLEETLRAQDAAARALRQLRHEQGALDLETIEGRAKVAGGRVVELRAIARNRARDLIEDFMIAANGVSARFLRSRKFASIRRVVRTPERWPRIVALAADWGERLPDEPDAVALEEMLLRLRAADPVRFPDVSLSVIKLLGKGEYTVEDPDQPSAGHFGLAVRDYAHSTAPNRRYPDLITQRLLKAAIANRPSPYTKSELEALAAHCTKQEDNANKVERQVEKSAAALLLHDRVGESFAGIVTGASPKGTWVRVFDPPVEGKVVRGASKLDIGDRVRVKLAGVDVEKGYIDFARARS